MFSCEPCCSRFHPTLLEGGLAAFYTLYNPEEIPYYYGSPPGVALAVLRVFAALWFYYAVYTTQSNFNMKARI